MKKTKATLSIALLFALVLGMLPGLSLGLFAPAPAQAFSIIELPIIPLTDIPIINPGVLFTPAPRPTLVPDRPIPTRTKRPEPTAPPTKAPTRRPSSGGGQLMNNEGPLFLSFRADLTDQPLMFTPMDISVDGEFRFPLIGNASQVVGEVKVTTASGMVIVTYLVVNGVQVDSRNEFFTFFPDIGSVISVDPRRLQDVKLKFGIPYSIAEWLNSDSKVLLYINTPVSYNNNLAGLSAFSFQDEGYLQRMMALLPLMD